MAKTGMDEEALSIQRAAREIDKLDDASAQARVALYLYLRYTTAGDGIASGGPVALPPVPGWSAGPGSARQRPASGPEGGAPGGRPGPDSGAAGGALDGNASLAGIAERMVARLSDREKEILKLRFPDADGALQKLLGGSRDKYSTLGPDDLAEHEDSPAPAQRGLDLSGKGSEHDDDASDLDLNATPTPPPEIDTSELDGDPEVEI